MKQLYSECKFFEVNSTRHTGYCNLAKAGDNRKKGCFRACCNWESLLTGEKRIDKLEAETEAQVSAMNILHHKHTQEIEELKSSISKLEIINENKWRLW